MSLQRSKGFIETTLIIYAGIAFAAVAAVGYAYYLGGSHKEAQMVAKFATERLARTDMITDLAMELGARSGKRWEENQRNMNSLYEIEKTWSQKGVTNRYVPSDPKRAAACPVTTGWVRYHDERAAGLPAGTGPTAGTANTPSGVGEAEALETIGRNYAFYLQCKERVRQVVTKYDDVKEITNSAVQRMNERVKKLERKFQ